MARKITDFRENFRSVEDYYQNFKENRPPSLIPSRHRPDRDGPNPKTRSSQPKPASILNERLETKRINSNTRPVTHPEDSYPEIRIQSQPRTGSSTLLTRTIV